MDVINIITTSIDLSRDERWIAALAWDLIIGGDKKGRWASKRWGVRGRAETRQPSPAGAGLGRVVLKLA